MVDETFVRALLGQNLAGSNVVLTEAIASSGGDGPPRYIAPLHGHHRDD
jgi:hypothetical protein